MDAKVSPRLYGVTKPLPRESTTSWVQRVCQQYDLTYSRFLELIGRRAAKDLDLVLPEQAYLELSALCGLPEECFESLRRSFGRRAGKWGSGRHFTTRDKDLPAYRFCAMCWRDDKIPYLRIEWRFLRCTRCTVHRVRLSERCPVCRAPLQMHRAILSGSTAVVRSLADCIKCGADMRLNSDSGAIDGGAQRSLDSPSDSDQMVALRRSLWPEVAAAQMWPTDPDDSVVLPQTLPILIQIINATSHQVSTAGKPVLAGRAYLALWCRSSPSSLVRVISERSLAFECGLRSERAVSSWLEQLKVLRDLGFVRVAPGGAGDFSNVLLLNPYPVCDQLNERGWIPKSFVGALQKRRTRQDPTSVIEGSVIAPL